MGESIMTAVLDYVDSIADPDDIYAVLERDGGVIIDGLLNDEVVACVNDEVEAAVAAADPDEPLFNPIMSAFHGPQTRQVTGVPGISRTFATEVMCNSVLLALCDRVLLPSSARAINSTSGICCSGVRAPASNGSTGTRPYGATSPSLHPSCSSRP